MLGKFSIRADFIKNSLAFLRKIFKIEINLKIVKENFDGSFKKVVPIMIVLRQKGGKLIYWYTIKP